MENILDISIPWDDIFVDHPNFLNTYLKIYDSREMALNLGKSGRWNEAIALCEKVAKPIDCATYKPIEFSGYKLKFICELALESKKFSIEYSSMAGDEALVFVIETLSSDSNFLEIHQELTILSLDLISKNVELGLKSLIPFSVNPKSFSLQSLFPRYSMCL